MANGLSAERLTRQLGVVDAVNEHLGGAFTLLKGIEVDILDDGSLDQTPRCSAGSTCASPPCTPSCGWTPPR